MRAAGRLVLLLALVLPPLAGAAGADWSKAKKITVTMAEYEFKPAALSFKQGVAYRLHLDNQGKETHEFTAPDFFKAIEPRDTKPLNTDHTEIVVQPGQKKDLYFVAKQPGDYDLRCSDHDWAGMVGKITISP